MLDYQVMFEVAQQESYMVRYRGLWSQVTWVTSRAATKALVMVMMREMREIEQVESDVEIK